MNTPGAVAGGHPLTVAAGIEALASGGNAIDAAVAAQCMACVAEPLLTGLAGGGLAIVRRGGGTRVLDFFSDVPGVERRGPAPAQAEARVDFGPDTQIFHYGVGSVAVPALVYGLLELHRDGGRLPLTALIQPAVRAARAGLEMSVGLCRSIGLLEPILRADPGLTARFLNDAGPKPAGSRFAMPALADTFEQLAVEGLRFIREGDGAADVLSVAGEILTAADLRRYTPTWRTPVEGRYRGATLQVPGPPSQAGLQVLRTLTALEAAGPMPPPAGGAHLRRMADAMRANEAAKGPDFQQRLFEPGFARGWLGSGYTTHLSTVDGEGNAVGITSSLGETAGVVAPRTGLILNNFLGEADVNPPAVGLPPGARLMTMCCPTLLTRGDRLMVLGTGGSSRIRSAIAHGVVYTIDHDLDPLAMVNAPRAHFEDGVLRYETVGRPDGHDAAVADAFSERIRFDAPGLFFGGLHVAGLGPQGFFGAGDHRRSGCFSVSEDTDRQA